MENPFSEGENRVIRPPATALVIFGATGDLTKRKLIPALYNLAHDDYLPSCFVVIGAARTKLTDEQFRNDVLASVKEHSRRPVDEKVWARFAANMYYQPVDGSVADDFAKLRNRLTQLGQERSENLNYLYYLSVAPEHFGPIAANLKHAGLVEEPSSGTRRTSLIIEKPFGHDVESARTLNAIVRGSFAEEQIFRIDHYLGKETVQNILVLRFSNGVFEPLWNHNHIDNIQISVCENIGVGSRASYFDNSGILRDIVQNHLLQMLSLLCIEPPLSLSDANSIRDEKVKVLRAIKRFSLEEVATSTARAQYSSGFIDGQPVPGYRGEKGVRPDSETETYVAMRLEIDNWRWVGVPIYVRAGKRLPRRITEITIYFKKAPSSIFRGRQIQDLEQNALVIQVQPDEGIAFRINAKPPGPRLRVRPVDLDFEYGDSFAVPSAEAYERLILDSMKGDATLFIRDDEIEEAWDLLTPVMRAWGEDGTIAPPLYHYEAGSWGPSAAAQLLRPRGHRWRRL